MPLHHIIYQSTATQPFADDDLRALLADARRFNAAQHITGVLLYHDGQFLQVLEGNEAALQSLYAAIKADSRHTHLVKLADAPLVQRNFGEWSMAFRPVQPQAFGTLAGYLNPDYLAQPAPAAGPHAAALLAQIIELTFHSEAETW